MNSFERTVKKWSEALANPPKYNQNQTIVVNLLAVVFLLMAVLQVVGFSQFKDGLSGLGLTTNTSTWAVVVVIAEAWAALSFLGMRLNGLLRFFGGFFAVLVSGFWLVLTLQAIAGSDSSLSTNGFFGKYLTQTPGWWTVVEAGALVFVTLYALEISKK